MRSVHTSHTCNFQDMWKWKSTRPTTSQKLVTPLPTPFYTILLLHQQVLVLWCLGTNCLLSWPHAINLRLRRVGNSASYPDVSLSLDEICAQRKAGRRQRASCTLHMVPSGSSPVTRFSRSPLSFVIYSHHSLHNLYLVVSALFIVVFRLSRCGAPC